MSTPRKCRAEADNTSQAQKRSRLLASSTAGASEGEPIDLEESDTLSFEFAGEESVDLTAESPESDNTDVTGDGSAVQQEQNQQEQNQQDPAVSRAADNSVVPPANDEEQEPRDNDDAWPVASLHSPSWTDEYSQLLEAYEQDNNQQLLDSSALRSHDEDEEADTDVYSTDSESEEGESSEEETESSDVWAGGAIKCPICMDYYSKIVKTERLILSTLCGHIFCSQCLPVALETASFCPTCRTELSPEEYHPIYI